MSKKESKPAAAKKSLKLVEVVSTDPWSVCAEGEFINLWGVPFTFDGEKMIGKVSPEDAKAMKAAGRVK